MAIAIKLQAPSGIGAASGQSGTFYTVDANGLATITNAGDVQPLLNTGWTYFGEAGLSGRNNFTATTDPGPTNDSSQDYAIGSQWINASTGRVWECSLATVNAAVWRLASSPAAIFRNVLYGGDFSTNPFQRDVAGLSTSHILGADIAATPTYFADRWFAAGGASSAIKLSKVANTTVAGFSQALQFQRKAANANTTAINLGQVLESADCIRLQGQQVTLSFWAATGANYSGGVLTAQVFTGTAADDTAANMFAGSWTGSATPITATQALTATMTRYQFTGTIAAAALQVGVLFTFTPVGTAGTNDWIQFIGIQLELGASASEFEHRSAQMEMTLCQRYAYVIPEPATTVVVGTGMNSATNTQTIMIPLPTSMRVAPTVTVSAGSFTFQVAGTPTAVGGGFAAGSTHTKNYITVVGAVTATVAQGSMLVGGGGSGYIVASAEY